MADRTTSEAGKPASGDPGAVSDANASKLDPSGTKIAEDGPLTGTQQLLFDHFRHLGCPAPVNPVDTDDCASMAIEVVRFLAEQGLLRDDERCGEGRVDGSGATAATAETAISDEDVVELLARRAWRRRHSITWESGADEDRQPFLTAARLDLAALAEAGYRREADVLRKHADRRHCIDRSRLPMTVFGGVQIPYCICGMPWYENGCTPRQQLILEAAERDRATALEPVSPTGEEPTGG